MLRNSIKSLVAGLVAVAFVAPAFGAVIPSAVLTKDPSAALPFSSPDAALAAPWVSYVLSLTANGADTIQAVEVNIGGQLHQRWTDPDAGGAHVLTGNSTNKTNGDSHLLAAAGMLFASGPAENNPGTGSPLAASNNESTLYGVGSSLAGTFGPPGPALTSIELAYIVVPTGSATFLNIAVNALNPTGDIIGTFGCSDFGLGALCGGIIPENTAPVIGDLGPLVGDMSLNPPHVATIVSGTPSATDNQLPGAPLAWSILSSDPANPAVPLVAPTIDPATGLFSWNVDGSKGGTYKFTVQGTDNGLPGTGPLLSDTGIVTVNVIVPEPATLSLLGLALVGFVGFARRRS